MTSVLRTQLFDHAFELFYLSAVDEIDQKMHNQYNHQRYKSHYRTKDPKLGGPQWYGILMVWCFDIT